jgi:hypothetical protein
MLVMPVVDGAQPPEFDVQEVIVWLAVESEIETVVAGPV